MEVQVLYRPDSKGVHREGGSEGHEEKYRAVIEGATPLMNRSAKDGARSSPHYGGEGVLIHPSYQGVCGWHGTVYKRKNLELPWEKVRRNKGSGGVDGQSPDEFKESLDEHPDRLHEELKMDAYMPLPVRQHLIPKAGPPGKYRAPGIPTIYDRVCRQALLNRLEPIFDTNLRSRSFALRYRRVDGPPVRTSIPQHERDQAQFNLERKLV